MKTKLYKIQCFIDDKKNGNPHYYHDKDVCKRYLKRFKKSLEDYPNYTFKASVTKVKWKDLEESNP